MALQMNWRQRSRKGGPPLGLKNLGNSCYLNSVLQCLTYTPPLAQFCLSSQHSSLCTSLLASRDKECPFCILERHIARCLSIDGPIDSPSKIQKFLTLFTEHFRWGRQEDAHEFLRFVIDACHDTCLKLLKRFGTVAASPKAGLPAPPKDLDASADYDPTTVMKEIFGGVMLSQVKCLLCKGESNKRDEIMDISLDLYQSNSLKEALARFFQPEVLEGSNKYSCGKCKKLSVAKKQMFMLRAPNVFVIQLKRFEGTEKINRNIEFEETLVLSKFMYKAGQELQPEYNLFGSIVHSGCSPESGHYYAYIKDAFGRWYCCNDANVSLSSTQEVLSERVYILFYLRNNQNLRPSKNSSPSSGIKSSDSNGSSISTCQKSGELLKPVKLTREFSAKNNGPSMLRNGKVSPTPQIKSINLKNLELKGVTENGKGNVQVHNGASVEKCSDFAQSKKKKTLPEYSSMDESKMVHSVQMPPAASCNAADGHASFDIMDHCKKQKSLVRNGIGSDSVDDGNQIVTALKKEPDCDHSSNHLINSEIGCSNPLKAEVNEDNNNHIVAGVKKGPDCDHSSSHMSNKYGSGISASKRKSCDAERGEVPILCFKETSNLSTNNVSCTQSRNQRKHSPEELEKFKQVLARLAYSDLQSGDWADRLHNFMRTRKRLCKQSSGSCLGNDELRKKLIDDAKKTFTSQIPESLKAHLIERLRLFYQGKYILDASIADEGMLFVGSDHRILNYIS